MAGLTTHILDTHGGVPAAGVAITLRRITDGQAQTLAETVTNADGRTDAPLLTPEATQPGLYEIDFAIGPYFRGRGVPHVHDHFQLRSPSHLEPALRQLTALLDGQRVAFARRATDERPPDAVREQMGRLLFHGCQIEGTVLVERRVGRGNQPAQSWILLHVRKRFVRDRSGVSPAGSAPR